MAGPKCDAIVGGASLGRLRPRRPAADVGDALDYIDKECSI